MFVKNSQSGFTLVEVIIYIALIAFVIGAGVSSAFYLISSSDAGNAKTNTLIEAEFLLRKIDWALTGVKVIGVPPTSMTPPYVSSGSELSIQNEDGIWIGIKSSGSRVKITVGAGSEEFITSERVIISGLDFVNTYSPSGKPSSIKASFTADGKLFELVKYKRKI